tara:strand:+ start:344 stop:1033 length:690 start_codon:yes stop_codon:yes gene_type:complete
MFEAIIPLRSKSRGLKNKNILLFKNRLNLVNFTIKKLIGLKQIRKIYILTDSEFYKKKIIKNKKIDLGYIRNKALSSNNSKIDDLIQDFLTNYNKEKINNNFLLFQVTSPMLYKREIIKTLNFIKAKKIFSLMHVTKVLENPHEVIQMKKRKWNYLMKKRVVNRQNYDGKFLFITGSLFFFTRSFFKKNKTLISKKTFPFEIDRINFIDIDDKFTFELAKKIANTKTRN